MKTTNRWGDWRSYEDGCCWCRNHPYPGSEIRDAELRCSQCRIPICARHSTPHFAECFHCSAKRRRVIAMDDRLYDAGQDVTERMLGERRNDH